MGGQRRGPLQERQALMPPKVRRPAAAVVPRPARGVRRRPGAASVDFASGGAVDVTQVKLDEWIPGLKVAFVEGHYYGQRMQLSGEVRSLEVHGGAVEVKLLPLGSPDEELVKWTTANPGQEVRVHLCPLDCALVPDGEGIFHGRTVQQMNDSSPPWTMNLKDAIDELESLRLRQREAERKEAEKRREEKEKKAKDTGKKASKTKKDRKKDKGEKTRKRKSEAAGLDGGPAEEAESLRSSTSSRSRDKSLRIQGQKSLDKLYSNTGLDPDPVVRRRVRKKVMKGMKKKKKRSSSSSSASATETSWPSEDGELP